MSPSPDPSIELGYQSLLDLIQWASDAQASGEDWADDVLARFQRGLTNYSQACQGVLVPATMKPNAFVAPQRRKGFVCCPPLLRLGGEDAKPRYEAVFKALYLEQPLRDLRGKWVDFGDLDFDHSCYKEPDDFERLMGRRARENERTVWRQERADRLHWMLLAFCHPGVEIRADAVDPENYNRHLLRVQDDPVLGLRREVYGVVTRFHEEKRRIRWVSAYPLDDLKTLQSWEDSRPIHYIEERKAKQPKKRGKGKHRH